MIFTIAGAVCQIDDADAHLLDGISWRLHDVRRSTRYVRGHRLGTHHGSTKVYLHRLVAAAGVGQFVDHINGDGLDNRRTNLRVVDHADNQVNTHRRRSGAVRGFWFDKRRGTFSSVISVRGKRIWVGSFATAAEASQAYEDAARRHFGELHAPEAP